MVNKLQIVRVDNVSVQRLVLRIGNNVIGRGAATGVVVADSSTSREFRENLERITNTSRWDKNLKEIKNMEDFDPIERSDCPQHVDNPIVENAVTIDLSPNGKLTMTPMLACYMKSGCSTGWQSLKVGRTIPVQSGDVCSLVPQESWFKILSSDDSDAMEDNDVNGKRKATNPSGEEPPDKKLRSEGSVETIYSQSANVLDDWDKDCVVPEEGNNCTSDCAESNDESKDPSHGNANGASGTNGKPSVEVISLDSGNATGTPLGQSTQSEEKENDPRMDAPGGKETSSKNRDEAGKKIKWDCGRHFSDQTDQRTGETAEEDGQASAPTKENPAATAVPTTVTSDEAPRNKCTYGSQCYRRNSDHRSQFSHPGDPDYDVPDDRPECPYGVRCYRKNPQHKRDFKHTTNRRNRAQTPVRARTPNATSETEQSSAEESIDESDYEPSIGVSDDYESDWDRGDYDGVSDLDDP